ncbi:hypothetical protein [Paenibacillus harenae]|uniref:DUF4163 domain-containing protein n=1 Tax=Paenibacillus harenae TaxID=306543 RepID=A0ABT9U4S4_PAEHA|nr:hypothetical protein [Paenibacillus harenae]MDQ0062446.1 hypothetical protein [Paenibacillus harenae]MDQ0114628.1 hypothetical protein [Paenibacillus harenae]
MKISILLFLAFVLVACGNIKYEQGPTFMSDKHNGKEPEKQYENTTKDNKVNVEDGEKKIEIKKMVYTDREINIQYPEIVNSGDTEMEKKINKLIESEALKIIDTFDGEVANLALDVVYTPMWIGENFLSVIYGGTSYVNDGAHPTNIFFTTNIDIKKGEKIRLQDTIRIDDNFIELFKTGKYVQFDSELNVGAESKDEINIFTNEELKNYFRNSDEISDLNGANVFTYYTEDSLGVSIEVPHVLGDHVEFEINFRDLKQNILPNSAVWNDIEASFSQ